MLLCTIRIDCLGEKGVKRLLIYIHGKGGSVDESEHFKALFGSGDVVGFGYKAQTPWDAKEEFSNYFDEVSKGYNSIILVANSIGAYFSLCSLADKRIGKTLLISPVIDMEKLIYTMMNWANISKKTLKEKREITTDFGETLSWDYLCYVRQNPIKWKLPTYILYGENDKLITPESVSEFAQKSGAELRVMPNGEHWFHTAEQMQFLDKWFCDIVN